MDDAIGVKGGEIPNNDTAVERAKVSKPANPTNLKEEAEKISGEQTGFRVPDIDSLSLGIGLIMGIICGAMILSLIGWSFDISHYNEQLSRLTQGGNYTLVKTSDYNNIVGKVCVTPMQVEAYCRGTANSIDWNSRINTYTNNATSPTTIPIRTG